MRQKLVSLLQKSKHYYENHERTISISAMVLGFIVDNLTIRRIDFLAENIVLISYLVIAGFSIFYINLHQSRGYESRLSGWLKFFAPITIQFAFGGLFSAFFVFYFRSASLSATSIFIVFLFLMMVANEIFAKHFVKITFQISVFFLTLFSFFIFYIPVITGRMGLDMFIVSAGLSVLGISIFTYILFHTNRVVFEQERRWVGRSVASILIFITVLYLTNLIPPIPLAMKKGVVAYDVSRVSGGDYNMIVGETSIIKNPFAGPKIYIQNNQPVYVFSSVFAPTKLTTKIVHEWQVKTKDGWQTATRTTFPIVGGSDRGYRGYSLKQNIYPGKWRVNVETERGQTIGRIPFTIEEGQSPNGLSNKVY